MEILLPITAVILVAVFVGYLRRERPQLSCSACDSLQIRLVEKQLKELKQDRSTGHAVKLDVQLIMETKYRCQACDHTWTIIAPES